VDRVSESESQQLFSSQSDTTDTGFDTDSTRSTTYGTKHTLIPPLSTPQLDQTLALLYLSLTILKQPITLGDIHHWVTTGQLPYYHATRHLPAAIAARLPATYHFALDAAAPLTRARLRAATAQLAAHHQRALGVRLPPLNAPLLLHRAVADLALPLPAFAAARALPHLLGWAFGWPEGGGARRARVVDYPDARLAGVLVVAVKLLYPFEGGERCVAGAAEMAAAVVDWSVWGERVRGPSGYEWAMGVREEDVLGMSGEQVDEYLDWYAESYMNDERVVERGKQADFRRYLLETFPVEKSGKDGGEEDQQRMEKAKMKRLNKVISTMKVQPIVTDEQEEKGLSKILRPGENYKRYRNAEELPLHAKKFYEAVAKWVGFDLNMLINAVFLTEIALEKWMNKEKQKENGAERQRSKTSSKGKQKVTERSDGDSMTSSEASSNDL